MLAVFPALMIQDGAPRQERKKISLRPYLWGVDRFTLQVATIGLFIGLTVGLVGPFMNVYFVYHLGTSREFFSNIAALVFLPAMLATTMGPILAARIGIIRANNAGRFLALVATIIMALTTSPLLGAGMYWAYWAILAMAQPLWFAFTMDGATAKSKAAVSAWLEITFWIGMGLAARWAGQMLVQSNYALPFYLSAAAAVVTIILTQVFVGSRSAVYQRGGNVS